MTVWNEVIVVRCPVGGVCLTMTINPKQIPPRHYRLALLQEESNWRASNMLAVGGDSYFLPTSTQLCTNQTSNVGCYSNRIVEIMQRKRTVEYIVIRLIWFNLMYKS